MEGLIPFVYKAIMQYKYGNEGVASGTWICDSPSYSYMRLPGDSGRFQNPTSASTSSVTEVISSSSVQSSHPGLTHRRIAA
ncbi:hypothetical protein HN51_005074 [Arachis hypogaea]|uniref:Uncharacterized protein n=1 Tax=Arachis hypogaea TaxID=3818 RepID=A0A445DG82_ARAHY|nr:Legume-specific protein [Arachis hypogaea]RYR62195.1 hypothetical protein Ahy_A04g019596 [Arachis hypogaea]